MALESSVLEQVGVASLRFGFNLGRPFKVPWHVPFKFFKLLLVLQYLLSLNGRNRLFKGLNALLSTATTRLTLVRSFASTSSHHRPHQRYAIISLRNF
jgi:hypothetical protein